LNRSFEGSITAGPYGRPSARKGAKEPPMKGAKGYMDLGAIFDEIFEAAQNFSDEFHRNFNQFGEGMGPGCGRRWAFDENIDYYPNYSYPPMNVYMTTDRSMIFEFALAGFNEKDISLSFQGDYMVFSAKIGDTEVPVEDNFRYFKRRLKMKDIEKQKYYVPLDKYAQEKVNAVYKNGILKVSVPPKDEPDQNDGIKIEIIKEEAYKEGT
jgi:HSP20 family molecular chaperone IbpA